MQTYISALIHGIRELGWDVRVFQQDRVDFKHSVCDGISITGICIPEKCRKKNDIFVNKVLSTRIERETYITLYASEIIIPSFSVPNSMVIQHGIYWDVPSDKNLPLWIQMVKRYILDFGVIKKIQRVDHVVCVDYNFVNWYRAHIASARVKLSAVPNFTALCPQTRKTNDKISIIFARRFFEFRGTRIFTEAIEKLLTEYNNIQVLVAGTGPDESYMKKRLARWNSVVFTQYTSSDSLTIHSTQHIAVVPSIGSEGTSLSLLEAMAAECAVVCTNVGGMTNIILDRYNGRIINPNVDDLYEAIK